jgi:energy-converting hydrogenase Eha subunit C
MEARKPGRERKRERGFSSAITLRQSRSWTGCIIGFRTNRLSMKDLIEFLMLVLKSNGFVYKINCKPHLQITVVISIFNPNYYYFLLILPSYYFDFSIKTFVRIT